LWHTLLFCVLKLHLLFLFNFLFLKKIASKNFTKLTKYTRGAGMFNSQQIHKKSRRELSKVKPEKKIPDLMRKSSSIIEISQANLPLPIKTIKISDESNVSANVLYKSDEKCINYIKENLGNPIVHIKKLKHNEDIIFSMLTNCKAKIQKAKKTGHLKNPTTSKASNSCDSMIDESVSNDSDSYESYNINNLNSEDESDKENLPKKRIPLWAQEPNLSMTVEEQASKQIPYKELFRASANTEIKLKMSDKHKRVHSET